ncbi:MAG: hypothetical protein ACHRHE_12895 [Tepidisphaerales bacterium]
MHMMRWAAVSMLGAMTLAGCTKKVEPPAAPFVPPPGISQEVRERMLKLNPNVMFGSVVAVRASDQLVAVADLPVDQCRPADPIIFYAGDRAIDVGTIERIVNGVLHVRYKAPEVGERAPEIGDVAVKFKAAGK